MEHIKIATLDDFKDVDIMSFSIVGKKVGVIKKENGSFYAIEVACKHQGADLTKGMVEGVIATCPCHDWQYDLVTGECLNHASAKLRRYDLYLEGQDIYISLFPST